jgi:hypothetical protein
MKKQTTQIKSQIKLDENGLIAAEFFTDDGKPIKATSKQVDNGIVTIFDEPITVINNLD